MARFEETFCSQCGRGFGPGDEGYSHCADHQTGWKVFRDGNQWCAVGPGFVDLQESDAGFGDDIEGAIADLKEKVAIVPKLSKFEIDFDNERRKHECERYEACEEGRAECHCLAP